MGRVTVYLNTKWEIETNQYRGASAGEENPGDVTAKMSIPQYEVNDSHASNRFYTKRNSIPPTIGKAQIPPPARKYYIISIITARVALKKLISLRVTPNQKTYALIIDAWPGKFSSWISREIP